MTETEALELFAVYGSNAMTAFTVFISFTFGFLATAYFVGSQLTPLQALVASGLYAISAGSATLTHVVYIHIMFTILKNTPNIAQDYWLLNGAFWWWAMAFIQGGGILVSLYFMWSIRRPKTG